MLSNYIRIEEYLIGRFQIVFNLNLSLWAHQVTHMSHPNIQHISYIASISIYIYIGYVNEGGLTIRHQAIIYMFTRNVARIGCAHLFVYLRLSHIYDPALTFDHIIFENRKKKN